jgi:hypothetical protein
MVQIQFDWAKMLCRFWLDSLFNINGEHLIIAEHQWWQALKSLENRCEIFVTESPDKADDKQGAQSCHKSVETLYRIFEDEWRLGRNDQNNGGVKRSRDFLHDKEETA